MSFNFSGRCGESFGAFKAVERRARKQRKRVATGVPENGSDTFYKLVWLIDDVQNDIRDKSNVFYTNRKVK